MIDNPVRALFLSPQLLLDRLPIRSTDRVLEVGPGSGYFSVELARRVAHGRLELLDLQPQMLAKARRKLDAAALTNVGFTAADAASPLPFPPASIDLILLVAVLGEIPDPGAAAHEFAGVLKPSGILAIHEHVPDPDLVPLGRMRELVEPAGFTLGRVIGPRWNFTAIFARSPSRGC
jgi:ubiquinone/menaquinone biosynthesis C-methylase UbiE